MSTLISQLSKIHSTVCAYYLPVVFLIGIFSNLANIIVFRRGNLRKNVCSWYFICLSIAQIILLFASGLYRIISAGWSNGYDLSSTSTPLCKFRTYLPIFSLTTSRHFLCLICMDRWMKTSHSIRVRDKSSPKYGRWLIVCSFIFWMIYALHAVIWFPDVSIAGCVPASGSIYQLFYSVQNIVIGIVPVIFMTLFSLLITNNLRRRDTLIYPAPISTQANANNPLTRQRKTDFQLIRLSIIQIIFFLLCNIMVILYPFYSFMTSSVVKSANRRATEVFIGNVSQYLVITSAAVSFDFFSKCKYCVSIILI